LPKEIQDKVYRPDQDAPPQNVSIDFGQSARHQVADPVEIELEEEPETTE
jgi:hypothetical protein